MKIGFVADKYKDQDYRLLEKATAYLEARGVEVIYPHVEDRYGSIAPLGRSYGPWEGLDSVLSLGGDGTFLYTCHKAYSLDIPVIGVNLGKMGFMTEIEEEDLEESLDTIIEGRAVVKEKMMLDVRAYDRGGKEIYADYGLNDAVLYRGSISQIIPCRIFIDGVKIETIPSDGIIVAGPTGSTGYALSCGGPIVDPNLEMMLITPISPHTLHNRSYVIEPESVVGIEIARHYPHKPQFSVDGRANVEVDSDVRIEVRRAKRNIRTLSVQNINFFRRIPEKISARGMIDG
jgi:NAD+ kinase